MMVMSLFLFQTAYAKNSNIEVDRTDIHKSQLRNDHSKQTEDCEKIKKRAKNLHIERDMSSLTESFNNLLINTDKTDTEFQSIEQAGDTETNANFENSEMSEQQQQKDLVLENKLLKEEMLAQTKKMITLKDK